MMCGTAENRAEGMEGNGGGLPKSWGKVGFGRICSTCESLGRCCMHEQQAVKKNRAAFTMTARIEYQATRIEHRELR